MAGSNVTITRRSNLAIDLTNICERAATTRDCRNNHEWVVNPATGMWVPLRKRDCN